MYELKDTPFATLRNIVVRETHQVVAHIVRSESGYTLYEQGALWEGDNEVAGVDSWKHGLAAWQSYAE